MYLDFYGFNEAPFNLTPDSKFLFLSHRHQEALAALLFGVQERKGFILLTGEIGCGKTTLCRALRSQFDNEEFKFCFVLNSYLTDIELLKEINEGFGLDSSSDSKKRLLDNLNNFLVDQFSRGHNVVLIIDESQNLRPETLEQIRMISNLETETAKLIQIILVGQPELRRTLALPELEQLNQRITVRHHITPLDEKEVAEYIRHRLSVAQPNVEVSYTDLAARQIYHYSRGVPRRINVICDRCLLVGFVHGKFNIDDKVVKDAIDELRGASEEFSNATPVSGLGGSGAGGGAIRMVGWGLAIVCLVAVGILLSQWLTDGSFGTTQVADSGNGAVSSVTATPTPSPRITPDEGIDPSIGTPVATPDITPRATDTPTPIPTQRPVAQVTPRATPTPDITPSPTSTPEPRPTVAPEITPPPTATPTPEPSPVPASTPPPAAAAQYADWETDPDGFTRVNDMQLTEAAAYLSALKLWNIEVDLAIFRRTSPAQVARFDLLSMIKPLNFDAVVTDKLDEALRLNMPSVVRLNDEDGPLSRWGLLTAFKGDEVTWIDPLKGKMSIDRSEIQPRLRQIYVLFKDPTGFKGAVYGEQSNRVLVMQRMLNQKGIYNGSQDGKFGPLTDEALRLFQSQNGLEPSGLVDAATALILARELNSRGPRLISHEFHFQSHEPRASGSHSGQELFRSLG